MNSIKKFNFKTKNEFHQFIIKHTRFLADLIDIQNYSGIDYNFNKDGLYKFLKADFKKGGSVFLIYDGKDPIGAIYGYNNVYGDREFTLSFFAIKKEYQRKGFGKKLLKFAYDELLNTQGYKNVCMFSSSGTRAINKQISGLKNNGKLKPGPKSYKLDSTHGTDKVYLIPKPRHILK
ncbi:MAG TPA: GNAT family N-acetyltransferase [archaeon]|jgi:GNAT superfamily N-acetyltransferase|nr:GNAT family N-acetyltransferase [archaeon]